MTVEDLSKVLAAVHITRASSDTLISSSKEFKAWDTSGFMDANVLNRSSVPYFWLDQFGQLWVNELQPCENKEIF